MLLLLLLWIPIAFVLERILVYVMRRIELHVERNATDEQWLRFNTAVLKEVQLVTVIDTNHKSWSVLDDTILELPSDHPVFLCQLSEGSLRFDLLTNACAYLLKYGGVKFDMTILRLSRGESHCYEIQNVQIRTVGDKVHLHCTRSSLRHVFVGNAKFVLSLYHATG